MATPLFREAPENSQPRCYLLKIPIYEMRSGNTTGHTNNTKLAYGTLQFNANKFPLGPH